jgi:hypothetical protein
MIATAVPTRRREMLAIDIGTVLRLPMPFVNPLTQLVWARPKPGELTDAWSVDATGVERRGN